MRWFVASTLLIAVDGSFAAYVNDKPSQLATAPAPAPTVPKPGWTSLGPMRAFRSPVFPADRPTVVPANVTGVDLVLPDFNVLFSRIAEVSPLSRQVLEGDALGGFDAVDPDADPFQWKKLELNPKRLVHHVEKIDNFNGVSAPLIRLRSRLRGPKERRGERFSRLLTDYEHRTKWDKNIADIHEMYLPKDLLDVEGAMGGRFGTCTRFGLGYCRTRQNIVSPREQLTLCGIQDFPSGASMVWGVELEDDQDHLMPEGKRQIRTRSHIFTTALIPTGEDTFDAEYVIQLEVGKFPQWLAGPVTVEVCKGLFKYAQNYFEGG